MRGDRMIYTPEELAEMAAADAEIEREAKERKRENNRRYYESNRDKIAAYYREYRRRKKLDQRAED